MTAILRGAMTVQPTSGLIQGIYERAINCLVERGYFVSLIEHRRDLSALAILVRSLPVGVVEGTPFRIDTERIVFEASRHIVSIELAGVPLWQGKMPAGRAKVWSLARILKQELPICGRGGGFLALVSESRNEGTAVPGKNIFHDRAEKILLGASEQLRTSGTLSGRDCVWRFPR